MNLASSKWMKNDYGNCYISFSSKNILEALASDVDLDEPALYKTDG